MVTFRIKLNGDQEEIIKFANEGHNQLLTGQAGVGKSEAVKRIIIIAKACGNIIGVVCSSGISCLVYSFYGLMTAELPWGQVIDQSIGNGLSISYCGLKQVCRAKECLSL